MLAGLDNLADAQGVLQAAQAHASRVFSARDSFFLVNGSSGGILAAVHACCSPGTVLLTSRASHTSVFNAVGIAGTALREVPCRKRAEGFALFRCVCEPSAFVHSEFRA